MMTFYGFEYKYYSVREKISEMDEDDRSHYKLPIELKEQELNEISELFQDDVKYILSNSYDFFQLQEFFEQEIKEIERTDNNNDLMNALSKFDKILMLTVRLLELKGDLETSIQNMKEFLKKLITHRKQVERVILDFDLIVDKKYMVPKIKHSILVGPITMILIALLS